MKRSSHYLPQPYEIQLYDAPSLFSGKLHAVICRGWQNRVKGRDLYDYIFFLTKQVKCNLPHLRERLIESGYITKDDHFTIDDVKQMIKQQFEKIDFEKAKEDVRPFIRNSDSLHIWSKEFFLSITDYLQ